MRLNRSGDIMRGSNSNEDKDAAAHRLGLALKSGLPTEGERR
jgi:hypothetical protein